MTRTASILLAEDEPTLRVLVTRMLGQAGYTVVSCRNGAEALAEVREEPCRFHLLLTDLMMPGVNGYELALRVRHACPGTSLLLMTGYAPDTLSPPAELRDVPLLVKPFTQTDLLAAVDRALATDSRS